MENNARNQDKAKTRQESAALERAEIEILNQEFASADWETFKLGKSHYNQS